MNKLIQWIIGFVMIAILIFVVASQSENVRKNSFTSIFEDSVQSVSYQPNQFDRVFID